MMDNQLFEISGISVSVANLLLLSGLLILFTAGIIAFNRYFIPYLSKREYISIGQAQKGRLLFLALLFLLYGEAVIYLLDIQVQISNRISVSLIVDSLILLVLIYLILWLAANLFIHRYFLNREKSQATRTLRPQNTESTAIKTLRWLLFSLAVMILVNYIDWDHTFWTIKSTKEDAPSILIRFSNILQILIIYLVARLFIWVVTQLILHRYYNQQEFEQGIRYSINKLLAYIVYFIATIVALRSLGMDMGLLLGGAAALLVGIGLALQSTFSDFFAGLVLLFERPVAVGDFVTYEGKTVQVQKIGLRASKVKDRDSVNFIIPNSNLISQTVINWSYDEKSVRFQVKVGVAYGSDTRLVEKLLLQAAGGHPEIHKRPKPKVTFRDFGNSSLDFVLGYHSTNIYNSEWVKSDLRFRIDELFRENNVTIPFPQRDVWLKK